MAKAAHKKKDKVHPLGAKLLVLEEDRTISLMIKGLAAFCGLLLLINLFIHLHGYFAIEAIPGFYGVAGFVAFAFIIFATKALKAVIGRDEDYYAPHAIDAEKYPDNGLDIQEYDDA